jgi:hypothetical protein
MTNKYVRLKPHTVTSSMPTYIASILVLSDVVHTDKILGTSKEEFTSGAGTAYASGTHEFTPGF